MPHLPPWFALLSAPSRATSLALAFAGVTIDRRRLASLGKLCPFSVYNPAFHGFERRSMAVQLPTLVKMLSQLIAIPSMSSVDPRFDCGNRAVVECLAKLVFGFGVSS